MRTYTTLIYTDGTERIFGVFHGPMKGKAFNVHEADLVARYRVVGKFPSNEFYRECSRRHSTAEAPPVYWQA